MKYEKLTYGEIQELVQWCQSMVDYTMEEPSVGYYMVQLYNNAAKTVHPARLDHQLLSDIEMLRLKFFGIDDLLLDWKRWHNISRVFYD